MCIVKVAQNMDVLEKKLSSEFGLQLNVLLMPNQERNCMLNRIKLMDIKDWWETVAHF